MKESNSNLYVSQKLVQNLSQKLVQKSGKQEHWNRIPDSVLEDVDLSASARCVYTWLAGKIYKGNVASVGVRRIAMKLGFSKTTVASCLLELKERGHIKAGASSKERGRYQLTSNIFPPIDIDNTSKGFSNPELVSKLVEKAELVSQPRKRA